MGMNKAVAAFIPDTQCVCIYRSVNVEDPANGKIARCVMRTARGATGKAEHRRNLDFLECE